MEKSELISSLVAELRIAYPNYFKDFNKEMTLAMVRQYSNYFSKYEEDILKLTFYEVIKTSKYMPSIAELIERCERNRKKVAFKILSLMEKDGYFKKSANGELDEVQEFINREKAVAWLNSGNIPEWFKKDMNSYLDKKHFLEITNG